MSIIHVDAKHPFFFPADSSRDQALIPLDRGVIPALFIDADDSDGVLSNGNTFGI